MTQPTKMISRSSRVEGALLGLLVGDAVGVPYEFSRPGSVPQGEPREMEPPAGFDRAHLGTPAGTWSDDGAQALVFAQALLDHSQAYRDPLRQGLVRWLYEGYMAVDGRIFDCGLATAQALKGLRRSKPDADPESLGNGSLMRVLPLALHPAAGDGDLILAAHEQSAITHPHTLCQVSCALYVLWVRAILSGHPPAQAWDRADSYLDFYYRTVGAGDKAEELEKIQAWSLPLAGSGHVVDCLLSARKVVCETDGYEAAVRAAVQLGNDTDTTAAVAGGAAGALYGLGGIPAAWLARLRGRDLCDPVLARAAEEWG